MALTVKDIENLLTAAPGSARGGALFHKVHRDRYARLTPAQRQFIDEMVEHRAAKPAQVPEHPELAARRQPREQRDLDAAELVWLQRLPHDPSAVSFEDAMHLASLATAVKAADSPTSARLIQSVWAPVKALHDERVARAEVERARTAKPHVPATTAQALSDAISAEHPDLSPEAYRVESDAVAERIETRVREAYEGGIAQAERSLGEARADQEKYAQTEREVANV